MTGTLRWTCALLISKSQRERASLGRSRREKERERDETFEGSLWISNYDMQITVFKIPTPVLNNLI